MTRPPRAAPMSRLTRHEEQQLRQRLQTAEQRIRELEAALAAGPTLNQHAALAELIDQQIPD